MKLWIAFEVLEESREIRGSIAGDRAWEAGQALQTALRLGQPFEELAVDAQIAIRAIAEWKSVRS